MAASVDAGAGGVEARADREIREVVPAVRSAHEQDLRAPPMRAGCEERKHERVGSGVGES